MSIDQWTDIDFTRDDRYVPGYNPQHEPRLCAGRFEDSFALVPRSEWRDIVMGATQAKATPHWYVTETLDQGNEGSCVGNAGTQAHMMLQAKAMGRNRVVRMSAISLYKQIGSSANSGAMVDDCIDRMSDTGLLPLDTPENRARFGNHVMPPRGFSNRWPDGWKQTAAKFSGVEGYACKSVDEMVSALLKGFPVQVGRAGHSITYVFPSYDGSTMLIDYINSWSTDWGFAAGSVSGGFGRDSARYYQDSADWCYAFQAADPSRWDWQ